MGIPGSYIVSRDSQLDGSLGMVHLNPIEILLLVSLRRIFFISKSNNAAFEIRILQTVLPKMSLKDIFT